MWPTGQFGCHEATVALGNLQGVRGGTASTAHSGSSGVRISEIRWKGVDAFFKDASVESHLSIPTPVLIV